MQLIDKLSLFFKKRINPPYCKGNNTFWRQFCLVRHFRTCDWSKSLFCTFYVSIHLLLQPPTTIGPWLPTLIIGFTMPLGPLQVLY